MELEVLRPKLIYLRVTRVCNAKCPYCPSWRMPKEFPEFEFLQRVISEIAETEAEEIRLTGGEVCLYNHLFDLVQHIADSDIKVSVITNGTIFHERFLHRSLASPIGHYLISLDTPIAVKHNDLRVLPGLFETAVRGIDEVRKIKPELTFDVNMVVSRDTIGDIKDAIDFARRYEVAKLNLIPIKDWPALFPTREQIERHNEIREDLVAQLQANGIVARPSDLNLFGLTSAEIERSATGFYPGRGNCFVPYQEAFVDAITGLVWPCDSTPYEGRKAASCGDLKEKTFGQIWYGDRFKKLRHFFATADPVPCSHTCDPANGVKSAGYAPLVQLARTAT